MSPEELLNDELFRETVHAFNIKKFFTFKDQLFCHYKQRILDTSTKGITLTKHTLDNITVFDHTSLTQEEIDTLVDAKIKYDLNQYDYDKFSQIYRKIISENNNHVTKYDLLQVTPDLLHEIIHKNEVFISNLNSLYASNKILAELDAL